MTSAPLILGYNLMDVAATARAESIVGNVAAIGRQQQMLSESNNVVFAANGC